MNEKSIVDDVRKPGPVAQKLRYVFAPPGWSHDGSKKTSAQLREELEHQLILNRAAEKKHKQQKTAVSVLEK